MNDQPAKNAWVERVLGLSLAPQADGGGNSGDPDPAGAEDEAPDISEDIKEQAALRAGKIRAVYDQIEAGLKTIKALAEGKGDKKPGTQAKTQQRYALDMAKKGPGKLSEMKKTDLDALEKQANFLRLLDEYNKAVSLLSEINSTLTKGLAVPELDHPAKPVTPVEINQALTSSGTELPAHMQKELDKFAVHVTSLTRIAGGGLNPAQRLYFRLADEVAEASTLKQNDREKMQARILLITRQACLEARAAQDVHDAVKNRTYVLAKLLRDKERDQEKPKQADTEQPKAEEPPKAASPLLAELGQIFDSLGSDCQTAGSLEALRTAWLERQKQLEAVDIKVQRETVAVPAASVKDGATRLVEKLQQLGDLKQAFIKAGKPESEAEALVKRVSALQTLLQTDPVPTSALQEAYALTFRANPGAMTEAVEAAASNIRDPASQAACKAALEAKFDIKLDIPEGMTVERLPSLYELMDRVPAGHFKGTLTEIGYEIKSGASSYGGGKIKLVGFGPTDTYTTYHEGQGEKQEQFVRFNATTLHEVGHAADDKLKVMKNNAKSAGFGEWTAPSLDDLVDLLYTNHFSKLAFTTQHPARERDLKAAIRQLLNAGRCDPPVSAVGPLGSLFADWNLVASAPAYTMCQEIRDPGSKPWEKRHDIGGGRGCHESYPGRWVTYSMKERNEKQVRPYQWRAPGEWFADFYAYYYAEKDKEKRKARAGFLPASIEKQIVA